MDITKLMQKHNRFYLYHPERARIDISVFIIGVSFILLILNTSILTSNYLPLSISLFVFSLTIIGTMLTQEFVIKEIESEVAFIKKRCTLILKQNETLISNINEELLTCLYLNNFKTIKNHINIYSDKINMIKVNTEKDLYELLDLEESIVEFQENTAKFIKRVNNTTQYSQNNYI